MFKLTKQQVRTIAAVARMGKDNSQPYTTHTVIHVTYEEDATMAMGFGSFGVVIEEKYDGNAMWHRMFESSVWGKVAKAMSTKDIVGFEIEAKVDGETQVIFINQDGEELVSARTWKAPKTGPLSQKNLGYKTFIGMVNVKYVEGVGSISRMHVETTRSLIKVIDPKQQIRIIVDSRLSGGAKIYPASEDGREYGRVCFLVDKSPVVNEVKHTKVSGKLFKAALLIIDLPRKSVMDSSEKAKMIISRRESSIRFNQNVRGMKINIIMMPLS